MTAPTNAHLYEIFELLVGKESGDGYPLTVTQSPAGEANGLCRLNPRDGELLDTLGAIERSDTDADFLIGLGDYLFGELFVGAISALYRSSLNMVRAQERRLRVQLRIEPPELSALPWEYLHDAAEDAFLATSLETALVRFVPMRLPARPSQVTLPLRVLVVIAQPHNQPALSVAHERSILEEALAERIAQGKLALQFVEHATVANISQALRSFQPHVFHFVGHGAFIDDHAAIVLEDADGDAHFVDERLFRELFGSCQATRVAVLNACQTATSSSSQPLAGLAPRLLQRQLSAVVAMQYPIADTTALIFAREFYRTLALGYGVDAAIAEARKGIFVEVGSDAPDWGTPVLFLRAKDSQLFAVEETVAAVTIQASPPPEPLQPPDITGFVGRETELNYYSEQLQQRGMAVITGMTGVGKSALAAVLVRQTAPSGKIFWHAFHPDQGFEILIWKLAAFMAWYQQPALWDLLEGTRLSGGQLPALTILLDYACQMVRGQNYLLCLDDFQYVDHDPLAQEFAIRIHPLQLAGEVKLIITSHRIPDFARDVGIQPLAGMSRIDAVRLLGSRNLHLTDALVNDLYRYTEGNAEFLTIAIAALERASDPAQLIARLTEDVNLEGYLLNELDATLTAEERDIESSVAVLGAPSSRAAIEETLDADNIRRPLHSLSERYLLTPQDHDLVRKYGQHAILSSFYYSLLGRGKRERMHQRAAAYFEYEETDLLRAAQHYVRADNQEHAAQLAVANFWTWINQGHARLVAKLLAALTARNVTSELWLEVLLAQGISYTFLGENQLAQRSYLHAQQVIDTLSDSPQLERLQMQLCLGLGKLLLHSKPMEAKAWLQRGLDGLGDHYPLQEAELLIQLGAVNRILGELQAANTTLDRALSLLPKSAKQLRMSALIQLQTIYIYQSDFTSGNDAAKEALEIAKQLHDAVRIQAILGNWGGSNDLAGNWREAQSQYAEALDVARNLGDLRHQAIWLLNLGILQLHLGEHTVAATNLATALAFARQINRTEVVISALAHLAELALVREDLEPIPAQLTEAEALAETTQIRYQLTTIYTLWANYYYATKAYEQATHSAQRAIVIADELKMHHEKGMGLRILGQIQLVTETPQTALDSFRQSLDALAANPYEAARTQLAWGRYLITGPDVTQGHALLAEAQATFARLGATQDLTVTQTLLTKLS